jgi:hypothetical protein
MTTLKAKEINYFALLDGVRILTLQVSGFYLVDHISMHNLLLMKYLIIQQSSSETP